MVELALCLILIALARFDGVHQHRLCLHSEHVLLVPHPTSCLLFGEFQSPRLFSKVERELLVKARRIEDIVCPLNDADPSFILVGRK
jgi:hypothetical protein